MQGINDGAGALVLASEEALVENEKLGLKPLARVVGYEAVGCKPSLMGIGPVTAIRQLLENAGLTLYKIDLFEVNEVESSPPPFWGRLNYTTLKPTLYNYLHL